MPDVLELQFEAPPAIALRMVRAPRDLPADMGVLIAGKPGDPDSTGALMVANRLSEFAVDPAAQLAAQQNIGLGSVDPLAYYILAKA